MVRDAYATPCERWPTGLRRRGGRERAQVGVAAQYAAIAPGSAQTWLVKTTARLNCEAKRRDGGAVRAQCYTCVWVRDAMGTDTRRRARGDAGRIAPLCSLAHGTRLFGHLLERDENGTEPLLPLRQLTTPVPRARTGRCACVPSFSGSLGRAWADV